MAHEALSRDTSLGIEIAQTKVESIRIYRASVIDEVFGTLIPTPEVKAATTQQGPEKPISNIPFDIDDLEVPDDEVQSKLSDAVNPEKIEDFLKRQGALRNPLNWQRSIEQEYFGNVGKYVTALRKFLVQKNKALYENISNPNRFFDKFKAQDITQFTTIQSISKNIEFGNEATVNISIQELNEKSRGFLAFIPKENDILEIKLRYTPRRGRPSRTDTTSPFGPVERSESVDTVFVGLISGISFKEQVGQVTDIVISAYGASKLLIVNKMVTDRAIVSQFENGELAEPGIVVWDKLFAFNTVDEIFNSIMINQLAMTPKTSSENIEGNDGTTNVLLLKELNTIERTLKPNLLIQINKIRSDLRKDREEDEVDKFFNDNKESLIENTETFSTDQVTSDLEGVVQKLKASFYDLPLVTSGISAENLDAGRELVSRLIIFEKNITQRSQEINEERKGIQKRLKVSPQNIEIDYEFDKEAFKSEQLFQFAHIPLTTLAAFRGRRGDIVAKFRGKRSFAFEQTIRSGFQLFFSQVDAPSGIMEDIRRTAKHVVYENENNQIVAEIPRYNDFSADDGEFIDDFIITNPLNMETVRQDLDLITRLDTKAYFQLVGQLPFTLTAGYYTDTAVLSRYGMRAQPPSYNPNARTREIASLFSSIEMANRNANTRTIEMEVAADRQYKLGRLYFIARKSVETKVGGPISGKKEFEEVSESEISSVGGLATFKADKTQAYDILGQPITLDPVNQPFVPAGQVNQVQSIPLGLKVTTQSGYSREKFTAKGDSRLHEMDGYVGYLTNYATNVAYGAPITHHLNFSYVRKAKLLFEMRTNQNGDDVIVPGGKITANFKIIPDIGGLIDAVQKEFDNRNLDANSLFQQNQIPPKVEMALEDETNIGNTYFAINESTNALSNPAITLSNTSDPLQQDIPYEERTIEDADVTNAVPVMRVEDINGNVEQKIIQQLNLLDLRIRPLNEALTQGLVHLTFSPIFEKNKNQVFKAIYIPNNTMNPTYKIKQLRNSATETAFSMYILNPTKNIEPEKPINALNITKYDFDPFEGAGQAIVNADFSIKEGPPVHLETNIASFAMLLASQPGTLTINDEPINMTRSNAFSEAGKEKVKSQIDNMQGISSDVKTRLKNEFEQAVNKIGVVEDDVLLPVVFMGQIDSNVVIDNTVAGIDMSLLDIGVFSRKIIPGSNVAVQGLSEEKSSHANGNSIDFTLTPYYAMTGYVLKDHSPYILSPEYDPRKGGALHGSVSGITSNQNIKVKTGKKIARRTAVNRSIITIEEPEEKNLFDVRIPISKKDSPTTKASSDADIEAIFNDLLSEGGANFTINVDDLPLNDRFWYHIEAETEKT